MSITLAHLITAPFVQQVARALFEAGMLHQFATTLVDRPDALWQKSLASLTKPFKFDLRKQLSRRTITEVPLALVKEYPVPEILRLLVGRVRRDERLWDRVFHWERDAFDQWVAQTVLPGSQAIYGYEYNSLKTFQAAKQQGIACIYDLPSPEHDFVENLLFEELQQYPELNSPYRTYVRALQAERTQYRRQEWQMADVVIANSEFTKQSYAKAGLDVDKVWVVPYGAPPVSMEPSQGSAEGEPMRFLWAGTFSIRKGAHYLLRAWNQIQPAPARLDIYGAMGLPKSLLHGVSESISLSGTVPRADLYHLYRQSDVLVFPTLCDGFGMVITEAFAQGLPVIATDRAGAADLVRHGENGLIVPAGDAEALADALNWCLTHPKELRAMRQIAKETAARWQWADYRKAITTSVLNGLHRADYDLQPVRKDAA